MTDNHEQNNEDNKGYPGINIPDEDLMNLLDDIHVSEEVDEIQGDINVLKAGLMHGINCINMMIDSGMNAATAGILVHLSHFGFEIVDQMMGEEVKAYLDSTDYDNEVHRSPVIDEHLERSQVEEMEWKDFLLSDTSHLDYVEIPAAPQKVKRFLMALEKNGFTAQHYDGRVLIVVRGIPSLEWLRIHCERIGLTIPLTLAVEILAEGGAEHLEQFIIGPRRDRNKDDFAFLDDDCDDYLDEDVIMETYQDYAAFGVFDGIENEDILLSPIMKQNPQIRPPDYIPTTWEKFAKSTKPARKRGRNSIVDQATGPIVLTGKPEIVVKKYIAILTYHGSLLGNGSEVHKIQCLSHIFASVRYDKNKISFKSSGNGRIAMRIARPS